MLVYGKCKCFVIQMYVCVLCASCGSSQCMTCSLLMLVEDARGSPCTNNHCSTRYEQLFRHNKHTHTYQEAATNQDTPDPV